MYSCFFFQAEDGIRDTSVTGVQTCALPISYYAFQLLRAKRGVLVLPRGLARPSALLAAAGLVAAFVLVDRDRWAAPVGGRSEERRVGKECRCRWSACE